MANGTIIQQGRFTSDALPKTIQLRSDVDWMRVYNWTTTAAGGAGTGVEFLWMRGMAADTGIEYQKLAADESMSPVTLASGGFTLVDTSANPLGAINSTVTAISTAATPVVSATSTSTLQNGDIVRMVNVTSAQQVGGIDFTIGSVVANTSFTLAYMSQLALAGTTGSFYPVNIEPQFYPRHRFISAITQAASAVVTLTVTHGYTVGQEVRFQVPAAYGMTQMDNLTGTITAISTANNTVTVDIDSSAFTAFAFPANAAVPFTPAMMLPVGMAASEGYENLLDDATENQGYIGMILAAGTDSPAGDTSDVIYWQAGKAFSVDNE